MKTRSVSEHSASVVKFEQQQMLAIILGHRVYFMCLHSCWLASVHKSLLATQARKENDNIC
jgi:hypothetical protein